MGDFLSSAKARRSVRTFDGNGVDVKILDELKKFVGEINNPYGIEISFDFLDAKENGLSSPVLAGEKEYVTAKVKKTEHAEEAYGYSFEALLMKAHELGLGTVWIGGTMPREKFEKAAALADGEIMPCVSPLGVTARKMSLKEGLMRKGVKADTRMKFEELFYADSFATPLTEGDAQGKGIWADLEAVRIAPSAVNKQPWRVVVGDKVAHFYEKKDKAFANGEYDLQKVDLGIALYHFEQQALSELRKPVFEINDPGIDMPADTDYIGTYRW